MAIAIEMLITNPLLIIAKKNKMNVASLFVKCLENEGVTRVFGVPGEENEDLLFALDDNPKIKFIPCRHEQGAAFIANVWGRLTGEAGVCLSTLGPGATNLITGVADANLDKAPLVAITGQGDLSRLHHESHQLIDVVNMFAPITKYNTSIKDTTIVAEVIRKAFKLAELEKPGATHIELSEDIAKQNVPENIHPLKKSILRRPSPDKSAIDKVFSLLKEANYPIILAGNGAIRNRVSNSLTQLVKHLNCPVVSTFMGKGAVSDKLPQSLFTIGLGFKDFVMEAMQKADLVIAIGYDIAEYSPEQWNPEKDKKIIHIYSQPAEVYENYIPEIEVIGDIAQSVKSLLEKASTENFSLENKDWHQPIKQRIQNDFNSYILQDDDAFTVPGVLHEVRQLLEEDAIVISDVGAHKMWIARNYPTYCPNGCIISNGLASMGISLPGGIAASLLGGNRKVVSMMGDGGFMMNVQELETAKRLGVGYTIIVFNDNDYGLISWKQKRSANRTAGTRISNPDFVKLGESFGIHSHQPENVTQLKSILKQCVDSTELNLIAIPIDSDVNQLLIEKLNQYWEKEEI